MVIVRQLYVHGSGEGTVLGSYHHIDFVVADGSYIDAVQAFLLVICQGPVLQEEAVVPRVHCVSRFGGDPGVDGGVTREERRGEQVGFGYPRRSVTARSELLSE